MDDQQMLDYHVLILQLELFKHSCSDHYLQSSEMGKVDSLRCFLTDYMLEKQLLHEQESSYIQGKLHLFWNHLIHGEEKESN